MVGTLLLLLLVGGSTPLLLQLLLLRGGCITPPAVFVSPELLFAALLWLGCLRLFLPLDAAAAVPAAAAEAGLQKRDMCSPSGRCSMDILAH